MNKLLKESIDSYIGNLSSSTAIPGGGNTIALINSFACSLMLMSLRIAILKKGGDTKGETELEKQLLDMQKKSIKLAEEDSLKFKEVLASWKKGGDSLEKALKESAEVSLEISTIGLDLVNIIESQDMSRYSMVITDVGIALQLAGACFNGGMLNYKINVRSLKNQVVFNNLKKIRSKLLKDFNSKYDNLVEKIRSCV